LFISIVDALIMSLDLRLELLHLGPECLDVLLLVTLDALPIVPLLTGIVAVLPLPMYLCCQLSVTIFALHDNTHIVTFPHFAYQHITPDFVWTTFRLFIWMHQYNESERLAPGNHHSLHVYRVPPGACFSPLHLAVPRPAQKRAWLRDRARSTKRTCSRRPERRRLE
jgi:hypothetical protein